MSHNDQETPLHQDFIDGFNDGYTMAQYMPELTEQLAKNIKDNSDRSQGFKAGIRQYELELEKYPEWMKDHSVNHEDKGEQLDKDQDINKDDLEMDME
jgi:hypothetical protein